MTGLQKILLMAGVSFALPVLAVLAWNYETIREQVTPRPENGYMIYVTMDT